MTTTPGDTRVTEEYKGPASVDLAVASQPELLLLSPTSPTAVGVSLRFPGETCACTPPSQPDHGGSRSGPEVLSCGHTVGAVLAILAHDKAQSMASSPIINCNSYLWMGAIFQVLEVSGK